MVEKRNALGRILVSYAMVGGLFLWWLSWMASLAFEAIPEEVLLGANSTAKSIILQSMSKADSKTRLTLLVWSWWLIWLPLVSSFVARYTIGRNMALSFLASILFPFCIFLILYFPDTHDGVLKAWQAMYYTLKNPESKILLSVAISTLLYFTLRRTHSISDLLRGFMLDFGRMRRFPLTNWVSSTLYCLVAYLSSLFLIGWLGLQILATVAAWFMTTLLVSFVVALYLENLVGTRNYIKRLFKSPLKKRNLSIAPFEGGRTANTRTLKY
jgi:choline-glycine betaine transporter